MGDSEVVLMDLEALRIANEELERENEALRLESARDFGEEDALDVIEEPSPEHLDALQREQEALMVGMKLGKEVVRLRGMNETLREEARALEEENVRLKAGVSQVPAKTAAPVDTRQAAPKPAAGRGRGAVNGGPRVAPTPVPPSMAASGLGRDSVSERAKELADAVKRGDKHALTGISEDERKQLVAAMLKETLFEGKGSFAGQKVSLSTDPIVASAQAIEVVRAQLNVRQSPLPAAGKKILNNAPASVPAQPAEQRRFSAAPAPAEQRRFSNSAAPSPAPAEQRKPAPAPAPLPPAPAPQKALPAYEPAQRAPAPTPKKTKEPLALTAPPPARVSFSAEDYDNREVAVRDMLTQLSAVGQH